MLSNRVRRRVPRGTRGTSWCSGADRSGTAYVPCGSDASGSVTSGSLPGGMVTAMPIAW